MTDSGIRVRVRSDVAVLTRTNVLAHVAREILSAAGASRDVQSIALTAIRDRMLERLRVVLYAGVSDEPVGLVSIRIDWKRHLMLLGIGGTEREFRLDTSRPVTGQVAPALEKVSAYIQAVCLAWDAYARTVYTPVEGKSDEFDERYGTVSVTLEDRERLDLAEGVFHAHLTPRQLSELAVDFWHKPPR